MKIFLNAKILFYLQTKKLVVIGRLMLEITDYWSKHRGHIWYKTRPSEQKKGYCTQFVRLLCEKTKEFGIKNFIA